MAETATARASSRDAFIETTAALLRRQGYAATGLSEIVARSGAPRGSLYFHFPGGKEELATAALARAGEQLRGGIEALLGSRADLGEALAGLLDVLAAGLEASGYADGCPLATVTLEAAGASDRLREAAAGAFSRWLDAIAARIEQEGVDRDAAHRRDTEPLRAVREELVALARA